MEDVGVMNYVLTVMLLFTSTLIRQRSISFTHQKG